ncbi:MAG: cell division protein FtsX [uncultured bacterium]|nr:MAG: cell division protein FtsX [uncultured bacterium]
MPSFLRILKFGSKNFWRNIWLSVATVLIMVITLFIISTIVILNLLTNAAIDNIENKVDISVYFRTDASEEDILDVRTQILNFDRVETTTYISKDEALKQFREEHKDDEVILQSLSELDENPLEPTLIVKTRSPEDYQEIAAFLEGDQYKGVVSSVNFEDNREVIEKLVRISGTVRKAGIAIGAVFFVIAILVVFNTIRLTIYTHREEIGIMKLVGATNWFVRGPFILEGVLYGLIGAVVTVVILYPILNAASARVTQFFEGQEINIVQFYMDNLFWIVSGLMMLGVILGIISSSIAVGRYLRK